MAILSKIWNHCTGRFIASFEIARNVDRVRGEKAVIIAHFS